MLYISVFLLLMTTAQTARAGTCHKSTPGLERWPDSFCVKKKHIDDCDFGANYKLSEGGDSDPCSRKGDKLCCAMRKQLPDPETTEECGLSYFWDGYRVIGGEASIPGQWPWAVSIEFASRTMFFRTEFIHWEHECGGVLIDDQFVLTAAHCFGSGRHDPDLSRVRVVLGKHERKLGDSDFNQIFSVSMILTHDNFNETTKENDIAIIQLSDKVKRSKYVQPICLAERDHREERKKQLKCFIMGWGLTNRELRIKADVLQHAEVKIFKNKVCRLAYNKGKDVVHEKFKSGKNICAGIEGRSVDACQGDSGGALACIDRYNGWQIAGVVSFGEGCGKKDKPGVYTSVFAYYKWITKHLRRMKSGD